MIKLILIIILLLILKSDSLMQQKTLTGRQPRRRFLKY